MNIFISYCHEDRKEIGKLLPYLRDLESPHCTVWSDHDLKTGDEWDRVINEQLRQSHILVPLVTQAYLRSRYCQEVEVQQFVQEQLRSEVIVYPIIVAPCEWQRFEWLRSRLFFPRMGTLLTDYRGRGKRDELMVGILAELRATAQRMLMGESDLGTLV